MFWDSIANVIWLTAAIFLWIAFFMVLFSVLGDLFRSDDLGGGAKTIWVIVLIFLPFLGCFIYLLARGSQMGERAVAAAEQQQARAADYIRSVASTGADEIQRAKQLLEEGTIDQHEFDRLKARALA